MAFEHGDLAQLALVDQAAQGQEVGVPAAVLEHAEHARRCLRHGGDGFGVGQGRSEGLVDHDRLAGLQRRNGLFGVQGVGRGDDDQADVIARQRRA